MPPSRRRSPLSACDAAIVAAYGLILPHADPRCAAAGLPQRPRLAAAALARRRAGAARDHGGGRRRPASRSCRWSAGSTPDRCWRARRCARRSGKTAGAISPPSLRQIGARLMMRGTRRPRTPIRRSPQPDEGVTYAAKIEKAEARIDFSHHTAADSARPPGPRVQPRAGRVRRDRPASGSSCSMDTIVGGARRTPGDRHRRCAAHDRLRAPDAIRPTARPARAARGVMTDGRAASRLPDPRRERGWGDPLPPDGRI